MAGFSIGDSRSIATTRATRSISVPSALPPDQPTPFSLRVEDEHDNPTTLNTSLYRVAGDTGGRVDAAAGDRPLVFEFEDASGLRARKEFRFDPDNLSDSVQRIAVAIGERQLNPGGGVGRRAWATSGRSRAAEASSRATTSSRRRRFSTATARSSASPLTSVAQQPVHEGQFRFAGVDDHYFLAAAVNPGQARDRISARRRCRSGRDAAAAARPDLHVSRNRRTDVRFFFGPKQFDLLRSIDPELVRAINFGMFGWLAVPLLGALQWIHGFVGNYGWSIVLLTILINLAIFPLRHKSVVSMRKMQALQPQLKAIQDRYAGLKVTDPARQKMNTEIMNLYREKGVNPASGCVPMLLQFPVLLAFYSMLSQSIELRGAEFGLWIHDLSQPDPVLRHPDPDGRDDVLADEDHADHGRSRAAAGDDDHAADVHRHVPAGAERPGDLLVRQQPLGDRTAVLHRAG